VATKVTSPRRLGIRGGSNGGLLMGVEFTQHPELWHAVVIDVPLLDMIRISKIAAGASWEGEYGSIDDPAVRAFWDKTSPYQNLRAKTAYPTPFIFTTTKDDRVGPQHARKFAARMEELGLPFYYYENTEGGHAAGANLRQTAHTSALEMTYLTRKLMDPVEPK
jgi:prolyl oligopeptidase